MSVLFFVRPSEEKIARFLEGQAARPFSYREVGATRGGAAAAGYPVNRIRGRVGAGAAAFEAGARALGSWQMYATGWTWVHPAGAPVREGQPFAVLVRLYGLWTLNACRVVYTLREEAGGLRREGFGIGTLPGHSERGEERFIIEWDRDTDEVHYELFAFARPRPWLMGLTHALARPVQRSFARASLAAMRAAAGGPAPG